MAKHDTHKDIHHVRHLMYVTLCVFVIFGSIYSYNLYLEQPISANDLLSMYPDITFGEASELAGKAAFYNLDKRTLRDIKDDPIAKQALLDTLRNS